MPEGNADQENDPSEEYEKEKGEYWSKKPTREVGESQKT